VPQPKTNPGRPVPPAPRWATHWRSIALAGSAVSFALWALLVVTHRPFLWFMDDLQTYRSAVGSLRHGQSAIYTREFGPWPGPFIYPPFAAVLFEPLALISLHSVKLLATLANLGCLAVSVWCAWGLLGAGQGSDQLPGLRRGRDRAVATVAVCAGAMWLEPVSKTFSFGQVSLLLMALCLVDLARTERRGGGLLIGLAAGIKLTPALFVLYLLATRRYRAAATAIGGFAGTVVLGWLLLPRAAPRFWLDAIAVGPQINKHVNMADGLNQSVHAALLRLLGAGHAVDALWVLAGGLIAAVGLAAAVRAHRLGRELVAILLCAETTLFVSPISWTHHWVWVVPTIMALGAEAWRRRSRLIAAATGAFVLAVAVWPLRLSRHGFWSHRAPLLPLGLPWFAPHEDGWDFRWTPEQFLVGDSLLLVNLTLFTVVAWSLLRSGGSWAGPAGAGLDPAGLPRQRTDWVGV